MTCELVPLKSVFWQMRNCCPLAVLTGMLWDGHPAIGCPVPAPVVGGTAPGGGKVPGGGMEPGGGPKEPGGGKVPGGGMEPGGGPKEPGGGNEPGGGAAAAAADL